MRLDRVNELVAEYGCSLKPSTCNWYDLYDQLGGYVDSLHGKQIEELQEADFIEFYLQD